MMHVLHAHAGNLYGGTERVLASIARHGHSAADLRSSFALAFEGRASAELRGLGAAVTIVGDVRLSRPWTTARARRRLAELAVDDRPDVMLCHSPWSLAAFGTVARDHGIPLAFWLHDALAGWHWVHAVARRDPPDIAICNSRFTEGTLATLFDRVRSTVIHPPMDFSAAAFDRARRAAVRASVGTPDDAVVVMQASRLEPWKGHLDHLRGLARLGERPWVLWIVGGAQRPAEERYLARLVAEAEALGLSSRIRFLGQRSDVPSLLAAADIYCQPNSGAEPFGLTFVEAMMAGVPVVASAIGGTLEFVTPEVGVLVPPRAPEALGRQLGRLIDDGELRRRLGAAGPGRARGLCDPATVMRQLGGALATIASPTAPVWAAAGST
jgi:glycosyltransferase involved in cell wall biosynthesis